MLIFSVGKGAMNDPRCGSSEMWELHDVACSAVEIRDSGQEQLISNGGRFKPAFTKRDKKQTMIDLRVIATKWFKKQ
jgi:hypothetical protein